MTIENNAVSPASRPSRCYPNGSVWIVYATRNKVLAGVQTVRVVRGVFASDAAATMFAEELANTLDESIGIEIQQWDIDG